MLSAAPRCARLRRLATDLDLRLRVAKCLEGGGRFDDVGPWFERLVEVCAENAAAARRR